MLLAITRIHTNREVYVLYLSYQNYSKCLYLNKHELNSNSILYRGKSIVCAKLHARMCTTFTFCYYFKM